MDHRSRAAHRRRSASTTRFAFVKDKGVDVPLGRGRGASDFDETRDARAAPRLPGRARHGRRVQGRLPRLAVPARAHPAAAAVAIFAEGLFNSTCRPESNGDTIACATEADQGNVVPMELMKRLLKKKGLHQAVMFHDVRWGASTRAASSGCSSTPARAAPTRSTTTPTRCGACTRYRQPSLYFPTPGGTFAGESLPGKMTWARALHQGRRALDGHRQGRGGEAPPDVRDAWWEGTTREWPFMAADMGISPRDADGALPVEPRRGRVRRRLRRDGRALAGARLQGARPRARARERTWSASTSASTSAPAARAPGVFDDAGRCTEWAVRADPDLAAGGGLRRAVVGRHLARVRRRDAARARRGESVAAPSDRGHRLRRDVLARARSTRRTRR